MAPQDVSQQPSARAQGFSASRLLAHLAPSATFRKGRSKVADDKSYEPAVEAHLCQLAMLENYADHGMYVKFTDDEAEALESRALKLAVEESKLESQRKRDGKGVQVASRTSSISSTAYSVEEAERVLAALRSDDDQPFAVVARAAVPNTGGSSFAESTSSGPLHNDRNMPNGVAPPKPPPKFSSFSAFKRKLMGKNNDRPEVAVATRPMPPGTMGHGYSIGDHDHYAREAATNGMDYSNGYIFPTEAAENGKWPSCDPSYTDNMEEYRMARALELSQAQDRAAAAAADHEQRESDGALMAVAMEESRQQAEYDQVLREAKTLRLDLGSEQARCREKERALAQRRTDMQARAARSASKSGVSPQHLTRELAEADHSLDQAEAHVAALGEAVEELGHLEEYIRSIKPPKEDAIALTEEITRQMLERLNFMGFDFHIPGRDADGAIDDIIAKYRKVNPAPPQPTPPSSRGSSRANSRASSRAGSRSASPAPGLPRYPKGARSSPQSSPAATPQSKRAPATAVKEGPKTPLASPRTPLRPVAPVTPAKTAGRALQDDRPTPPASPSSQRLPSGNTGEENVTSPSSPSPTKQPIDVPTAARELFPAAQAERPAEAQVLRREPAPSMLPRAPAHRQQSALSAASSRLMAAFPAAEARRAAEDRGGAEKSKIPPLPVPPAEFKLRAPVSRASQRMQTLAPKRGEDPQSTKESPSRQSPRLRAPQMDRNVSVSHPVNKEQERERSAQADPVNVKRNSQVVHLYNELRKVLPSVMEINYAASDPHAGGPPRRVPSPAAKLAHEIEVSEAAKADAEKHARLIRQLGSAVVRTKPRNMRALCEFVEDIEAQLLTVKSELAPVLSQFPDFPQARWAAMQESFAVHNELEDMAARMRSWSLHRGSYQEEAMAMEMFFDTVRMRLDGLLNQVIASERRWKAEGIPWDLAVFKRCRLASLHIATLFMSRALFEVANLERDQTLKHEACLNNLADATRIAYKVHQFAGGFHSDVTELFEKVKHLAQYYVRMMDPVWLRNNTKFPA